jgi:hypothetical protein
MAAGEGGHGVVGESTNPAGVGTGVKGSSSSTSGTGVRGIEIATTGYTAGVSGYVASPSGTAAVFNNAAGGNIIRGQNNGVNKFSVDGSGNVDIAGAITGNGAGLTGLRFSQLGGFLGSAQFSGTYSSAVALSNTANVYYGDGSHLTGTGSGGGGNYIWNGTSQQPNANFNISGTGTADAFNSATNYQIRGLRVLGVDGGNVFLGMDAGYNTTGYNNVILATLLAPATTPVFTTLSSATKLATATPAETITPSLAMWLADLIAQAALIPSSAMTQATATPRGVLTPSSAAGPAPTM